LRTKELAKKNTQLTLAMEEKDNLLHIVAHDLKSPLNQTKALSNLMAFFVQEVSEAQDILKRITTASDNGLALIEELSTVANLESDRKSLQFEEIDVLEKLEPSIKNFKVVASRKNITINVICKGRCVVNTYPPYLIRIVENLLSNAIKFSPNNRTVNITLEGINGGVITLEDQGPGFSKEDERRLFRKFQRLSALPTGGENSTGLGLYIVKILAERIQADISLKSEKGEGSSFEITFKALDEMIEPCVPG
jgi:two-component system sensor histidine kinase/response regulator